MSEFGEQEPLKLDLKPFRQISVDDLGKSEIATKTPIENLGIMAEFRLEKVNFDEIPFISGNELRPRAWRLTAKIERATPLPEANLRRIRILVRIYPEGKAFVGEINNLKKKVFAEWCQADKNGKPLQNAKVQPLLLDDNLIKIQRLEVGGFLQKAGRLIHD